MQTQLTIDFKAVAYARLYYKNQFGEVCRCVPKKASVHLQPTERVELAKKLGILDQFTVHCSLHMRNNHSLKFSGDKAKQIWKAYNSHIYGNKHI